MDSSENLSETNYTRNKLIVMADLFLFLQKEMEELKTRCASLEGEVGYLKSVIEVENV